MKLIIDNYKIPAEIISKEIFRTSDIKTVSLIDIYNKTIDPSSVYYIHEEIEDTRLIKYYFNEIVEIKNNLVYINKRRKIVKYYNIIKSEENIKFKEIKYEENKKLIIDKSSYLPHLRVQEDEVVIFPCEDEEDEE